MLLLAAKKRKGALEYVITVVFCLQPKNKIWKALVNDVKDKERLDIYELIRMDSDHITLLEYKPNPNSTKSVPLGKGLATHITNFQELYWECKDQGDPIDERFTLITADEFDVFQMELHQKRVKNINARLTSLMNTSNPHIADPLIEFKKGIKHDPASFPMLKDINQWDSWKRMFVAMAEAQGVQDVLEIGYSLLSSEVELFKEQQKYIYSVLLNTIKASPLKSIVINAKKDDIQKCWDDLVARSRTFHIS